VLDLYKFSHFENTPNLLHAVTTKSEKLPYAFSLALHTGEDKEIIVKNRTLLASIFKQNKTLHYVVANQTHSDNIKTIVTTQTKGWNDLEDAIAECDALITNIPSVVLTVLTADCVPLLLHDKKKQVVAVVHAGWRGTKAKIVSKTVNKMNKEYACHPSNILVGIAPSIGACCYEVAYDVAEHFMHIPKGCTAKADKYMLDLPYINKQQLLDIGIKEENIEMSNLCTACKVARFFSYRKEKGCSGRFMSMIALKDKHAN